MHTRLASKISSIWSTIDFRWPQGKISREAIFCMPLKPEIWRAFASHTWLAKQSDASAVYLLRLAANPKTTLILSSLQLLFAFTGESHQCRNFFFLSRCQSSSSGWFLFSQWKHKEKIMEQFIWANNIHNLKSNKWFSLECFSSFSFISLMEFFFFPMLAAYMARPQSIDFDISLSYFITGRPDEWMPEECQNEPLNRDVMIIMRQPEDDEKNKHKFTWN